MTPDERDLVLGLVQVPGGPRPLTVPAFEQRLGVADGAAWALSQLQDAIRRRDSDDVELALVAAGACGVTPAHVDPLVTLAGEDWHESHEEVVSMLGELRAVAAVDALTRLTWHVPDHLEWDESHALGRKAVHALGRIDTPESVSALESVLESGPEPLRDVAGRQLQHRRG